MSHSISQPINVTIHQGTLTLPNGKAINLIEIQAALNYGFQETGDHEMMHACDLMAQITGTELGPSGGVEAAT